jgi:phenylacetate-coenzyme A ligase PaaK-like adenylate-forming protein
MTLTSDDRAFWDVEAQTMPRDELLDVQSGRLAEAVQRAYEGSGFYRRRLEAAGVKPVDVTTAGDIALLPTFVKNDLRTNEAEHPPVGDYRVKGLDEAIRLATSTGTSGRPTFMLWTQHDLTVDYECTSLECTSFGRDNPTLRYDLQDVIRIDSTPCTCGETSRRAFYDGRLQDVVDVQGKWILPIGVWVALPLGVEYFLVRRGPSADGLELRIEGIPDSDLVDRLTAELGVPVTVEWVPEGSLPRAAYKAARVVDEPLS